jgi:hypothetical protein
MSSVLRVFIASAAPQPHEPVAGFRRKLLERMRARDEAVATACMAAYFESLNKHLLDWEQAATPVRVVRRGKKPRPIEA